MCTKTWNDWNKFDYSDYPETSLYYGKTNKEIIGKLKDEAAGTPITEFVGLRSKMYPYIKDNDKNEKKGKRNKNLKHANCKNTNNEHHQK